MKKHAVLQRLYIDTPLSLGAVYVCDKGQSNYLLNVLRFKEGGQILVFNGVDGEWLADVTALSRSKAHLQMVEQTRPQPSAASIHYVFAPLKRGRLDYMIQKSVEMGAGQLHPVLTHHTVADKLKVDRLHANMIEAAEQCGVLSLPVINPIEKLDVLLKRWPKARPLIFADEAAPIKDPLRALAQIRSQDNEKGVGVLIGPEGGFSQSERDLLRAQDFVTALSLGPRILRADTAAVACLALVNGVLGDWTGK